MRYAGGINYSYAFQLHWLYFQMIEQADTFAEQERCYVNVDLVHQAQI
jgi:hypothetical protein